MPNVPASLLKRLLDAADWVERTGKNIYIPPPIPPRHGPGIQFIHGKLDENIETGGTGTMSRWWQDDDGTEVDSGLDYEVYDWFDIGGTAGDKVLAWRDQTSKATSGRWYYLLRIDSYINDYFGCCGGGGLNTSYINDYFGCCVGGGLNTSPALLVRRDSTGAAKAATPNGASSGGAFSSMGR